MSDLRILPDVESMCVQFLRVHADVLALLADETHIASELPNDVTYPFLRAVLVDQPVIVERHLCRARVQLDGYGTTRMGSRTLCATAQAALVEMSGPQSDFGVVSGVATVQAARPLPDPVRERLRFSADLYVYAYPDVEGAS